MVSWIADRFWLPLALAVVRKHSCCLQAQSIFMMQPNEDSVSYNTKVAWNAMPMLLWWNRKTCASRIRDFAFTYAFLHILDTHC